MHYQPIFNMCGDKKILLKYKMSSFKSSGNIQKKDGGPDISVLNNQFSLVTLNELAISARESML